jgi:hypothetical protein
VEYPNTFVRPNVFENLTELILETIAEQDTILLGRKMYQEWSQYWLDSKIARSN